MRKILPFLLIVLSLALAACNEDVKASSAQGASNNPSATPAGSPLASSDSPSPAVPPTTAPTAAPTRTTAKPAATKTTAKASPTRSVHVTDVALTVQYFDTPSGSCKDGVRLVLHWIFHVDAMSTQTVYLDVMSNEGVVYGSNRSFYSARDGVGESSWITTIKPDAAHPTRTVDFWIQTVSPSRTQSNHTSYTMSCRV